MNPTTSSKKTVMIVMTAVFFTSDQNRLSVRMIL